MTDLGDGRPPAPRDELWVTQPSVETQDERSSLSVAGDLLAAEVEHLCTGTVWSHTRSREWVLVIQEGTGSLDGPGPVQVGPGEVPDATLTLSELYLRDHSAWHRWSLGIF